MTPKEVIKLAKEKKAACVDLKFMDFLGTWQHFTIPMTELTEGLFEEGSGFDGSSIRGCVLLISQSSYMVRFHPKSAHKWETTCLAATSVRMCALGTAAVPSPPIRPSPPCSSPRRSKSWLS